MILFVGGIQFFRENDTEPCNKDDAVRSGYAAAAVFAVQCCAGTEQITMGDVSSEC